MIQRLRHFLLLISALGLLAAQHGAWQHALGHLAESRQDVRGQSVHGWADARAEGLVRTAEQAPGGGEAPGSSASHTCVLCIAFSAVDALQVGQGMLALPPAAGPIAALWQEGGIIAPTRPPFHSRAPPPFSAA